MEGRKEQEDWNKELRGTARLEWRLGRKSKIGMQSWEELEDWNGGLKGKGILKLRVRRNRFWRIRKINMEDLKYLKTEIENLKKISY